MTHAMFRDEEPPPSVLGRRVAGRSGSEVVLTIGGMLTKSLVWRKGRALIFAELSPQEGGECFFGTIPPVLSGEAQKHVMRVPGSLASNDPD